MQNTRNRRFLFIKPNQLNTKKNADCPSSSLPTSSSKLSTTHIQNSLSEENLSYSCKLIFNSLPCPPTPCYYLHSISHCTHIHPKTYQLPPSTRAHSNIQDLPSKLLYSTDRDLEHHNNRDIGTFWKMDEFQEDPFLTTII